MNVGDIVRSEAVGSKTEFAGRIVRLFEPRPYDDGTPRPTQYIVRDDDGKDWQREADELTRLGGLSL